MRLHVLVELDIGDIIADELITGELRDLPIEMYIDGHIAVEDTSPPVVMFDPDHAYAEYGEDGKGSELSEANGRIECRVISRDSTAKFAKQMSDLAARNGADVFSASAIAKAIIEREGDQ